MFGKMVFVGTFLFATLACAHPNYQDEVTGAADNKPAATCALALANGLCVDLQWEKQPTDSEMGSFFLKFYSANDPQVTVDPQSQVGVVLWMPSMGHGSSPVKIQKVSDGIYRVYNVFFVMPGDWEIRIRLKNDKNETAEVIQPISI